MYISPSVLSTLSFYVSRPGRLAPLKQTDIMLKPLLFEVPGVTAETPFVGRDWLFVRLEEVLKECSVYEGRGAVIVGNAGSGKTAIIWRLVILSCHGGRVPQGGTMPASPSSSPRGKNQTFLNFSLIFNPLRRTITAFKPRGYDPDSSEGEEEVK